MLRTEVYARALCESRNVKRAEVCVGARCALWVGGASAEVDSCPNSIDFHESWTIFRRITEVY